MKKALLKKIPVVEAGIKDKQYMELCRQNYLMKVQKATVVLFGKLNTASSVTLK